MACGNEGKLVFAVIAFRSTHIIGPAEPSTFQPEIDNPAYEIYLENRAIVEENKFTGGEPPPADLVILPKRKRLSLPL
jgi:hypothetical protein